MTCCQHFAVTRRTKLTGVSAHTPTAITPEHNWSTSNLVCLSTLQRRPVNGAQTFRGWCCLMQLIAKVLMEVVLFQCAMMQRWSSCSIVRRDDLLPVAWLNSQRLVLAVFPQIWSQIWRPKSKRLCSNLRTSPWLKITTALQSLASIVVRPPSIIPPNLGSRKPQAPVGKEMSSMFHHWPPRGCSPQLLKYPRQMWSHLLQARQCVIHCKTFYKMWFVDCSCLL